MAKGNEAMIIIEEGTDAEVDTKQAFCCWCAFMPLW